MKKLVYKIAAFALGIVGMLGIKTVDALPVHDQHMKETPKNTPLYLRLGTDSKAEEFNTAWHSSHYSHGAHHSHRSHYSSYR